MKDWFKVNDKYRPVNRLAGCKMDKMMFVAGVLLTLAGLTGIAYGLGINLAGMFARGATDYSFITAYVTEWTLVLLAGVSLMLGGVKRK